MESNFLDFAVDSFVLGKFAACRSILEEVPDEAWRKSTVTRCLMENNLVVCSCKEQLMAGDRVNILEMINRLQTVSQMMQGLPPSLKCLPVEMTVSFNTSTLLLQQMNTREPVQASSNQTRAAYLVSTTLDQIKEITSTNLKRVFSAMGIVEPKPSHLEKLLSTMAGIAHFVPADIVSLVSLQCCLLGLCHLITREHQDALDVLNTALKMHSSRAQDDMKYISSLALIMSLQTGNFTVDVNCLKDRNSSSLDIGSLAQFLLVVCFFQTGQWDASLHHISTNQTRLPESLNLIQKFIQGYCLYQKGNFNSALESLTSLTESPDGDVTLKVKTLNLIGCCLAALNKPYTAVQKFQEALKTDFGYLCPLYNVSLMYRHLRLPDAEIEALDLLTKALKERHGSTDDPPGSDDIMLGSFPSAAADQQDGVFGIDEHSLSVAFVMYTLARRCWELGRHDDAVRRYKDLLRAIEDDLSLPTPSTISRRQASTCLPSIQTIYLEAAISFYDANDFQQSLFITDKIIAKMVPRRGNEPKEFDLSSSSRENGDNFMRPNGHSGDDALPGISYRGNSLGHQEPGICEAVPSCSRAHLSESTTNVKMGSKPNSESHVRSSCIRTNTTALKQTAGDKDDIQESDARRFIANTLLLKSNCLIKKKHFYRALDVINELLEYLSGVARTEDESDEAGLCTEGAGLGMEAGEEDMPRSKRRKIDPTLDGKNATPSHASAQDLEVKIQTPIGNSVLEIKAKAYNNKAMILIGQKKKSEALHMLLLSIQCKPDDIDALYNYALLLTKMDRKEEAGEMMKKLLVLEASLNLSPLSVHLSQK